MMFREKSSTDSLRSSDLRIRNRWILVTGASSGLGASIARELAIGHGANLLLVARRGQLMEDLALSIRTGRAVEIMSVEADLSQATGVEKVLAAVSKQQPVAAILNAGITRYGPISSRSAAAAREIVATNITGFTDILFHLASHFSNTNEPRAILAVSSLGGETTLPHQAAYGASKAYVTNLTFAARAQFQGSNVSIGLFMPGGIATDMGALSGINPRSPAYALAMSAPEDLARLAVRALRNGKALTIPGALNRAAYILARHLPRTWSSTAAKRLP